jgi:hypothetical protein
MDMAIADAHETPWGKVHENQLQIDAKCEFCGKAYKDGDLVLTRVVSVEMPGGFIRGELRVRCMSNLERRCVSDDRAATPEEKQAILVRLYEAWVKKPHMRLGQLLVNALRPEEGYGTTAIFYVEDGSLLDKVERTLDAPPLEGPTR